MSKDQCPSCLSINKEILEPFLMVFDNPGYVRYKTDCRAHSHHKWHGHIWENTELVGNYYKSKDRLKRKETTVARGKPL